jgi:hypothetical protein
MSDLLINWLNEEIGLTSPVQDFVDDFANGYLLGELLCCLAYQTEVAFDRDFVDGTHHHDVAKNFRAAARVLKTIGVPLDSKTANDVLTRRPNAAQRLIYQIKMTYGRLETLPSIATSRLAATSTLSHSQHLAPQATRRIFPVGSGTCGRTWRQ